MVGSIGTSTSALYSGQAALSLLSSLSTGGTDASNALLSYYQGKAGLTSTTIGGVTANVNPPTPPWQSATGVPTVPQAVLNAINGATFVDPASAKLNAPAGVAASDYKGLFALYQGLNSLYDLATTAAAAGTKSADSSLAYLKNSQLQAAFASGMSQVQNFLSTSPFDQFNLVAGSVKISQTSAVGVPNGKYATYTTGVIGAGDQSAPLSAFQGDVTFNISVASTAAPTIVKQPDGTTKTITTPPKTIAIDLADMGSRPRTIDNVVNYINAQLSAAKVSTRFATANLGTTATTNTLPNGQTTTVKGTTQWGLTIKGTSAEQVSFSTGSTAAAVYVAQATGGAKTYGSSASTASTTTTDKDGNKITAQGLQLTKLQTGANSTGSGVDTLNHATDGSGLATGQVFAKALPDGVDTIEATATDADGSVYVLANADGTVNNQPIQGGQGVALLKYNSAGKMVYSKVVSGLQTATGASIAINSDGSVAVAGTNTTADSTAPSGLTTKGTTSAFVQVYDPTGAPSWNKSVPTTNGASTATGVVFGADGAVYISGQTTGSVGNQKKTGDTDEFIQGFDKTGAVAFTKQFGTTGTNTSSGLAFDAGSNTLYTAGLENSQATVRAFALNTTTTGSGKTLKTITTATAGAVRVLGAAENVAGIGVTGGKVVVGGTSQASTIKAGTVTQAYKGVNDGFIASLSTDLQPSSAETVAYFGMSGATQKATALTVAGGQAYLTGTILNDPSSLATGGATEGFVSGVDVSTGAVGYSTRLAGANGQAAPMSIAAAQAGTSVLDKLGLPNGVVNAKASTAIVANTAIVAGQSFWVRTAPGGSQTQIKITATDTLDTLVNKINLAIGGQGKASVLALGANSQIMIQPNDASYIQLDSQLASTSTGATASKVDVLSALGLSPGVVRKQKQINGLTDVTQMRQYGLSLPSNLDLSTTSAAQHAANALQSAMSQLQKAYQDLVNPPTMASEAAAAAQDKGGAVPTYLTNQIANLQAGLNRLTGGG